MGYVRLEEHSDWGCLYLSLPGKGLSEIGTAHSSLGLKFVDGQRLHVRWLDNSQSEEPIVHRSFAGNVSDSGHTYPVTYTRPGIEMTVHGVAHWTPLADLWVLEEDVRNVTSSDVHVKASGT